MLPIGIVTLGGIEKMSRQKGITNTEFDILVLRATLRALFALRKNPSLNYTKEFNKARKRLRVDLK